MTQTELSVGQELHGFAVERVTPLAELNATLYELGHRRTGARYLHLARDDDNNLFAVGFRTPPRDSTGAPHILEHTVLCGSRRYPVRDPFFSMLKRSLNTFMNALTADDWTLYPFASQNRADFYNLMGVYLDAVFFPLLRERDFLQEGHRLEFSDPEDPASPLVIKGVVYNEMKGHMSDPSSLLGTRFHEAIYPTTPYGRNAGGEPAHIPELTWDDLRAFHAACYHPSNAYFWSYGDLPLTPHLRYVQEQALAGFDCRPPDTAVGDEVRFGEPRRVVAGYPVDEGEPLEKKSMVHVGWLTCRVTDEVERLGLELLSTLLLGNPAAPLHKALLDSRLGANLTPGSGYDDDNRETLFGAGLQGTDPDAAEAVEALVLETLAQAAEEGFTRERIDAAIQQLEFEHREVKGDHYPYGLGLLMRLMGPWIHGGDPVRSLILGENVARLRERLDGGSFFRDLIRRQLLENPHRVTLTLRPDLELKARREAEEAARLEAIRNSLTADRRQEVLAKARELEQAQEAVEDLSVLPALELSDIPREERRVPAREEPEGGLPVVWFEQPTNGIGYFLAHLDAAGLPAAAEPYLPLFCAALTQVGAAGQPYTTLAERIAAATGGIRAAATILDDPEEAGRFRAVVEVHGKALVPNLEKLYGILSDFFSAPDFGDLERLHTVLNQVKTSLENSLPSMGHRYAARAAAASLTPAARLRERWGGVEHLRFARQAAGVAAGDMGGVAERFASLARALLGRDRLHCGVTGEAEAFSGTRPLLGRFLAGLPEGQLRAEGSGEELPAPGGPPARRGLVASLPVSYCARVFPGVPFTHPDAAGLLVLAKLLRSAYLHREIREKGGAYGGMATYSPEGGLLSLLSYRDPNLVRTLGVFDDAAAWAAAGRFGGGEVKEAVLGVFSDLDRPLSPGSRGAQELSYFRQGLTREHRQRLREGILEVRVTDLARLAEQYLVAGRARSAVAVLAGEDALNQANRELGNDALALERV